MATLPELLKTMVESEWLRPAPDDERAAAVRVHGKLVRSSCRRSTPAETKQLAYSVLTDAQKKRFEETQELDFSFGIRGVGRFRCNVFNQRGAVAAVYRLIPEKIRGVLRSWTCRRSSRSWPSARAASCSSPALPAAASRRRWRR